MTNPELEEKLREAACFGDIDGVKDLISKGVNVNSQHDINGWTALHWAAKRNHLKIVNLLCNHGADKSISTNKGDLSAQLTSEGVIKVLLSANQNKLSSTPTVKKKESLPITPNYIRSPPLGYKVDTKEQGAVQEKRARIWTETPPAAMQTSPQRPQVTQVFGAPQELVLKVRVAGSEDPDYIEVEMPRDTLTLEFLIVVAAEELEVDTSQVERVRKMPNTRLRRDKEVGRLPDYQQLELVLKGSDSMQ